MARYQVIVTNNLFRPLGWTPPKPPPPFKLMTTVMKSNGRHKALLRNTGDRKLYYVVVGEVVGGATVEKIEARRVTLNRDGESVVCGMGTLARASVILLVFVCQGLCYVIRRFVTPCRTARSGCIYRPVSGRITRNEVSLCAIRKSPSSPKASRIT